MTAAIVVAGIGMEWLALGIWILGLRDDGVGFLGNKKRHPREKIASFLGAGAGVSLVLFPEWVLGPM